MMKYVFFILIYGLIVAVLGVLVLQHPGFAHFTYSDTSIEIKLIDLLLIAAIGLPVLYALIRLVINLFHLPTKMLHASYNRKQNAAFHAMEQALSHEIRLDTDKALASIRKNIQSSPAPILQHALAAQISQRAGKKQLLEEHITKLKTLNWNAADSLEAGALLDSQKYESVIRLVTGKTSRSVAEKVSLLTAYMHEGRLTEMEPLLTELEQASTKTPSLLGTIDTALAFLVQRYTEESSAKKLGQLWSQHNKFLQANPKLLRSYVRALRKNKLDSKAEQIVFSSLSSRWCDQLVREYGLLKLDNVEQRIRQVEGWLPNHKDSAGLYLTLGRLCKQARLWGKAKDYLHSSLSRRPLSETYAELAEVHEQLDEKEDAYRCAKKGIHLANQYVK